MQKKYRGISKKIAAGQAGQALLMVLVFFLLGSLTLTPVLLHMGTALKTGQKYEAKTNELYTADAGIDTGLWRIKNDYMGPDYDPFDFSTVWPYVSDNVNGLSADVYVQNLWLPSNVTLDELFLDAAEAKAIIESDKLVITGTSPSAEDPFFIKMEYDPADGDNLTIKSIGVWLPQGFEYDGPSDLEPGGPHPEYYPDNVTETTVPGGKTVVWSYNAPYPHFIDFPNYVLEDGIMSVSFSFNYDPPSASPEATPRAVAWVLTDMDPTCINPNDVPISWDSDMRYYKVTSASGATSIDTYESKALLRNLDAAIAGDFVAIGNSLMTGPPENRNNLLAESSTDVADVSPIPADADVIAAYLYWSGFQYSTSVWSDGTTSFNNWDWTTTVSQTRVPTADGDSSGTWNTAPRWDDVDETTPNDANYITGVTDSGGYQYFSFSAFTVPTGSSIVGLTLYIRAMDNGSNVNNIYPAIKVDNNRYNTTAAAIDPGGSYTTYSHTYLTNPRNGAAWTVADINGTGSDPLQQIGIYSTDLNPDITVSMVYAEVTYSFWSIYNNTQFQARGNTDATGQGRTLTLSSAIDLSTYDEGTIAIAWTQTETGTLEGDDTLYYSYSGDNGTNWSQNHVAFSDDSPESAFFTLVPEEYLTEYFKIRFYFNFNVNDEYARVDNIYVYYMPPDDSITFKINGEQVYLDENSDPQSGAQPLEASFSAILVASSVGTTIPGYFFACYKDVTKLVKTYPIVVDEEHHTGEAVYTVGGVTADTTQYVSYAGWSLIIIYGSPATAGHYLYLWDIHDIFTSCPQYGYLDFDHDGLDGGEISGFTFPEPIRDKDGNIVDDVAAKITCFVSEGDSYTGDYMTITGEQSGNSQYLYNNPTDPQNNIWNSTSIGMSYSGVDVDTFTVNWLDTGNIFTAGDTSVNLYMYTGQDIWNLIYIMMSVRSETDTRGTGHYVIDNN